MSGKFHEGELAVQQQAGVAEMAQRIGNAIKPAIMPNMVSFWTAQPFVVVSSVDNNGRLWSSILTGNPGFMRVLDAHTLQIAALPHAADLLSTNLKSNPTVGLIVIDFASRQRLRLNGRASIVDQSLIIAVDQAYGNCPKYIQARSLTAVSTPTTPKIVYNGETLSPEQQAWIQESDTFFVASAHPSGGADASHRGGQPGFVEVQDGKTLVWPDYSGNMMFNTLGNIAANPKTGLLFFDFATGRTLQLSGEATIVWEPLEIARFAGAERLVRFQIMAVRETDAALPFEAEFHSFSPFNP